MCLNSSKTITDEVLQGEWPRKVYKALKYKLHIDGGSLVSPFYCQVWKSGENVSDRNCVNGINHGFHVFLNRDDAEEVVNVYEHQVVVELTVSKDDFIQAGYDNDSPRKSAIFNKVVLDLTEYERVLKEGKEDEDWDDEDEDEDWDDEDWDGEEG